ncbi:MAG: flagellar filament capping protein FliD [Ignavibacteria bacterium]
MASTGTISSQGIGSGIDVSGIVSKLMAVEQQPLKLLDTKEASYQSKLTAFGTLKGAFASVQTAADALNSSTLFKSMSATASNTNVLSASANTAATAGSYSIDVVARAQGETIASQNFTSLTDKIGTADGQLKIELGTFSGGAFSPDAAKTPVTINVSQANSSLSSIRDAINKANAGVTARIVDVGGGNYKLLISSNSTGANTSLRITAQDDTGTPLAADNTGLAKLNFDPTAAAGSGNEYTVTMTAQDAHIKVNNLDIYRTANTISDVITGVTFTLQDTGTSTLAVAKDTSGLGSALDAFVKAYNTAAQQVRDLSAYDSKTKTGAVLTGDSTARTLSSALTDLLNLSLHTQSTNVSSLTDLGITVQRDGSLQFNQSALASALSSDSTAVSQLIKDGYNGQKGIATRMASILKNIMDDKSGVLATSTNSVNKSIADIDNQRTSLTRRLQQIQANYEAQFSAMDSFVASWNQTSTYLTQQLTALTNAQSSKNK